MCPPTPAASLFAWNFEAQTAFNLLKTRFSTAPVLAHLDPASQFIVEVDASDFGVGAVLSQRSPETNKLHPCASFFHAALTGREKL